MTDKNKKVLVRAQPRRRLQARLPVIAVPLEDRITIEALALLLSEDNYVKMTGLVRKWIKEGMKATIESLPKNKVASLKEYQEIVRETLGLKETLTQPQEEK